jgi:hypothetical protein
MQKRFGLGEIRTARRFDSGIPRAYANRYVFLIRRQCDVLLSPDAGVRVGTQRNSSQPTRQKRVGFIFTRRALAGAKSRADFRNLSGTYKQEDS